MFEKVVAQNGVVYFRSTLLPCPHGFSTRIGGVSALSHTASLNLAFGRGDEDETVLKNLSLFAEAVGVEAQKVISVPQIHSADVREMSADQAGLGYYKSSNASFDGYVTEVKGLPVGVKTADCTPVLLAHVKDGEARAVAAVHAGWRGTLYEIAVRAVELLLEKGAEPSEIFAAIGPSIHGCCYEVGEDLYGEFLGRYGEELCRRFIPESGKNDGKYFAQIDRINLYQLQKAGLPRENIDLCELCTACHPELFYSHRKNRGIRGTLLSIITPPL